MVDEPVRIEGKASVRMQHNSRASVDRIPMNLRINGERVAIGTFNLVPAFQRIPCCASPMERPASIASVEVEDAPIRFDDRWHFGYDVLNQIYILVFSSGSKRSTRHCRASIQQADCTG